MNDTIAINNHVFLPLEEIDMHPMRAQGAGGQNVNKVSSAIHLRFDINASSLPERYKQALLQQRDTRITQDGVLVLKAQRFRTQEANKKDAIERLVTIIQQAAYVAPTRKATKPTKASQKRRVDAKKRNGMNKQLRGKVNLP
ncbi:alternative ribosome rescue aminoacyl-tRNA hydrolase ArfB [Alteromonas facilis]|uniref:alternative ribosome rescue aminoacyl-tRNA hydrolase ArfB n=1 Tax=Alteromonas facilis TaxID=2048004 RepID=UPI000C28DB35|nr:alternative ribosome rescue aminoacyl-tRNA hydrolase ArfB [Alteromonas facilis]